MIRHKDYRGAPRPRWGARDAFVLDSKLQAYFVTRETLRRLKQSQNPCFAKDWKPAAHPDSPKWLGGLSYADLP